MKTTIAPFVQQVKDLLSHLHDHAYLQLHPLTATLAPHGNHSLHEWLCGAIEELRPADYLPRTDAAWRPYLALHMRYVEGLDVAEVAEALALSPRQCRREQQKGLQALADRLQQYLNTEHVAAPGTATPSNGASLETEVKRLGAGGDEIGETAVGAVLPGVIETLADFAAQRRVHMQTVLAPELPAVHVERVVLRQVLLNTLAHLLDRSMGGTITTSVSQRASNVIVQMACTLIQPQANREAEPSTDDERLAVVAQLLHMRHGTLTRYEQGMTIQLPARQRATVLVVDDNPDVIRLFRRYLSSAPHELIGTTSSDEALRLAQQTQPQAIVLDVMMPDRDGWEVLQYLRNEPHTRSIPVIVCSVLQEQGLARSLGAAHFLPKPVTRQALLAALSTVLDPHQQLRSL